MSKRNGMADARHRIKDGARKLGRRFVRFRPDSLQKFLEGKERSRLVKVGTSQVEAGG